MKLLHFCLISGLIFHKKLTIQILPNAMESFIYKNNSML